ncbi:hypothetical protein AQUCO_67300001v1 [Aquilegia coerulea]|uniref:Uncharacterized protein n=1 Tax=Aquilegia coerulea TaxID=218851 RepID=A0A2G5C0E9_AQUCA|nr:hypothetical protein AQUCO_67300001v1 [Aquilegia coerulea]
MCGSLNYLPPEMVEFYFMMQVLIYEVLGYYVMSSCMECLHLTHKEHSDTYKRLTRENLHLSSCWFVQLSSVDAAITAL